MHAFLTGFNQWTHCAQKHTSTDHWHCFPTGMRQLFCVATTELPKTYKQAVSTDICSTSTGCVARKHASLCHRWEMIAILTVTITKLFYPTFSYKLPANMYLLEHMQVNALLHSGICKLECTTLHIQYHCRFVHSDWKGKLHIDVSLEWHWLIIFSINVMPIS